MPKEDFLSGNPVLDLYKVSVYNEDTGEFEFTKELMNLEVQKQNKVNETSEEVGD